MPSSDIEGVLEGRFGFTEFRDGQRAIIETLLSGRDVVAVMPTGGGKSLCYQLPALMLPGLTLVVSPLIALMKDQVDALTAKGIGAAYLNSSLSAQEQGQVIEAARTGELDLLYVAPERFKSRRFLAALDDMDISLFAVDEAHCLSQWGHDFRPDYLKLDVAAEHAGRPTIGAFTATATRDVRADISTHLKLRDPAVFFSGVDRPNLFLSVDFCSNRQEKLDTIAQTAAKWKGGSGIVYASTRKNVDRVWSQLRSNGIGAVRYHAGLDDLARQRTQEAFMAGEHPIIVATNAFGMGVDKADIRFVLHFDFPGSLEAYYQEVGRAGRDGQPSECRLLFNYADIRIQEFFAEGSNPPRAVIEEAFEVLRETEDDVIEVTANELTRRMQTTDNSMAVSTAVKILDRYGALDRDRSGGAAWIQTFEPVEALKLRVARAPVQLRVVEAIGALFGDRLREGGDVPLERLARRAALERGSLTRALGELHQGGGIEYVPPFRGRAIRMGKGGLHRVDWEHLAEKARRDRQRIQDVVRFSYGAQCRKAALRDYFGVEDGPRQGCGSCDVCFGVKPPKRGKRKQPAVDYGVRRDIIGDELEVVRKVLACVARMKGRFGRGRVAQVLAGSKNQDVKRFGLDSLSTWGILKGYRQRDLTTMIDALIGAGLVRQRRLEDGAFGNQAVVDITQEGWETMVGQQALNAALPPIFSGKGRRQSADADAPTGGAAIGAGAGDWGGDAEGEDQLMEQLKAWRAQRARNDNVRAFYVLHNRVLKNLARHRPTTAEELLMVKGMGPRKVSEYGDELLELLLEHRRLSPGPAGNIP